MAEIYAIKVASLTCFLSIYFYRKWVKYNTAEMIEIKGFRKCGTPTLRLSHSKSVPMSLSFTQCQQDSSQFTFR